jgi:hypothetical protein
MMPTGDKLASFARTGWASLTGTGFPVTRE